MPSHQDARGTLYQIKVKGNLDPNWAAWFEGFSLSSNHDGETVLYGRLTDQAALYGLLGKINSLGIPLMLVARIDHTYGGKRCLLCGHSMDDNI